MLGTISADVDITQFYLQTGHSLKVLLHAELAKVNIFEYILNYRQLKSVRRVQFWRDKH